MRITFPIIGTLVLAFGGCGARANSVTHREPTGAQEIVRVGGVVQVPAAARQFLTIEAVAADKDGFALRAPARVAFRDGAVSQVGAPLSCRVADVRVRSGDIVRPGAALASLNCPEAAGARTQLASALASQRAARAAVDRETRMLSQGVGIERDKLAAEVRLSEVEAEIARARATTGLLGPGEGATVLLRAPIAGTVISRQVTVGAAVEPGGEPLMEIGNSHSLLVIADVFERDVTLVHEGAKVVIELSSLHGPLTGRVTSVGAVVNAGLRTAPVRVSIDGDTSNLRPGMFGRVRIVAPAMGPTLPTEAVLIKDGKESVVYVARSDSKFERRTVVVGQSIDGRVQVISGLAPGERVVTKGALLLDGTAEQLL